MFSCKTPRADCQHCDGEYVNQRCGGVPVRTVPSGRTSAQGLHHHSHGEGELLSHSAEAIWPHLQTHNEEEGKNDFHRI